MDYVIQLNYYNYINYIDYNRLLQTNKNYYNNTTYNNDNVYKFYLSNKFSEKFVNKARSIIISYYDCFIRIIRFENKLINMGLDIWNEDIYYLFWELKYNNKNKNKRNR